MAGFFENRQLALNKGLGLLDQGITDFGKGIFGKEKINEKSTGLTGAVIAMVRAPLEALFDEDRGLLNPKKGLDLNIVDENSSWNLMNLFRKAIGGVINTASTLMTKPIDVLSPKVGENVDKIFRGLANATLGLIVGDFSHYMGPREDVSSKEVVSPYIGENLPAVNDNSTDITPSIKTNTEAANDNPTDMPSYSGGNPPAANEGNKIPAKLAA